MNKLEEKYSHHEIKADFKEMVQDDIDLDMAVEELIRYIEKDKRKIAKDLLKNSAVRKIKRLTQLLSRDASISSVLDKDEELINELLEHIDLNLEYLEQIRSLITKDNFKELMRLVDFLVDYYISNLNYIQSRRTSLEHSLSGITYFDGARTDSRDEVNEFYNKTIVKYQGKPIEKQKKIW